MAVVPSDIEQYDVPSQNDLLDESTMVRMYWPRYKRRVISVALAALLGSSLIFTALFKVVPLTGGLLEIGIIFVLLLAIFGGVFSAVLYYALRPLYKLSSALSHISGEPTVMTPPNPNEDVNQKSGLKPLLQMIYELSNTASGQPLRPYDTADPCEDDSQRVNFQQALNETQVGMIIIGPSGTITYSNTSAPVHLDSSGRTIIDLLFENDSLDDWIKQCRDKSVHATKQWRRVPSGIVGRTNRRIYDIVASYQKGSLNEIIIMVIDLTDEYQPEDDNLDFIAFAAHELRGPITVIRGYLDVLSEELDDKLENDQKQLLERLVVSSNRLSGYVNNILNASRYDRRHLQVKLREENIATIYEIIQDDMRLRAGSQNRLLHVEIPGDLPTVAADRASITEVMANLIDNGLKYSSEGGLVNVTARALESYVEVTIKDYGIGMPASVMSNLFHKFYRSHRSRETVAGTGIGLYICKAIIESHGGTIGVTSEEGHGSTFSFTLPIYSTVVDILKVNDGSSVSLINKNDESITNHSMYRG